MQRLTLLLALTPLAFAAPQQTEDMSATMTDSDGGYSLPSSVDASAVLSGMYPTGIPAEVTGAVATSLASAIYSYEKELFTDPGYKSAADAVYMAAASASDSDAIFSSLTGAGAGTEFTTADWFQSGVDKDAQTAIESYWNGYISVASSVLVTDDGVVSATPTGGDASATETGGSDSESTPTETGATSSSTAGAPVATRVAMAGLAAGVAMGAFAAVV